MKTICICGGGALGHVLAGFLSARNKAIVNVLTNHSDRWYKDLTVYTADGLVLKGNLNKISSRACDVIPESDIVILCLPGFAIESVLEKIKKELRLDAFVGCVFSCEGFFFQAFKIMSEKQPLFGFQRVPFISRVEEYGKSAKLLGYRDYYNIAVERVTDDEKELLRKWIEDSFNCPTRLMLNYLEVSLTNSNPILHTSRLYTMFCSWTFNQRYDHNILFYEEWTDESSEMLMKMDREFFSLLEVLPVRKGYIPKLLDYYESHDAKSLTNKLSSIQGFKGITSPMKEVDGGWIPDFENRYFTEDFPFGLKYIWALAHEYGISIPTIDMVYEWGCRMLSLNKN